MDPEKLSIEPVHLLSKYLEAKPRTLLITSYTLGLSYLEKQLLSKLKKKADTNITIVTSALSLKESFHETVSLNGVGTEYYLFQINNSPYAFHSKLYFSVDEKGEITVFASGANFTYTGMCLNLDAVEVLSGNEICHQSKNHIISFLNELELNIKSDEFQRTCNKIIASLDKTVIDNTNDTLFVHNINEPIFDQIKKFIRKDVTDLRIVSPYFDNDMRALKKIVKDLNPLNCSILCNKNDQAVNLTMMPENIQVYIPDFSDMPERFVHAKAFIFQTEDSVYTCVGSANCTHAGLMSTSKTGNWEACILRRHKINDHADGFWRAFFPNKISKSEFWEYIPPSKTLESDSKSLSFNAVLINDFLTIEPISDFPTMPFDVVMTLHFKNGDEESINIQNIVEDISVEINVSLRERFGDDPVSVEVKIIQPPLRGRSWVMQEHQLRKTNKIRSLEKAIDQLQSGDPQGWDQALDIINFIVENLGYVSGRPKIRTNRNSKKNESDKIPFISEVVSVDEEIHVHGQSFLLGDFFDFNARLIKLIEKGIARNIDFPDDDDEDDVQVNKGPNGTQIFDNSNKESSPASFADSSRVQAIIGQIPSLIEIFQAAIFQPYSMYLKNADLSKETENMERFEAVLDTIYFCLKFTRFLRLELCKKDTTHGFLHFVKTYLTETAELLGGFWKMYPEIIKKHNFSDELLKDVFIKTGTLNEMIICLMEFWFTNNENHYLKKEVFFCAFENFRYLYGDEYFINSVLHHLNNTERFGKERDTLLFPQDSAQEIFLNIEKYHIRKQSVGELFERQVKYHYWKAACIIHEKALLRYQDNPTLPRKKFDEHQNRFAKANDFIDRCKVEGIAELGKDLCSRIYENQNVAGISEIKNGLVSAYCPKCNQQMDMDVYQTLKRFEWFECPQCKKLFIPVDKPKQYSFSDTENDPIWK